MEKLMNGALVSPTPGPLFTKKRRSYWYRDPHYKPKTVCWPSQVYCGNPYTDKTASSKWIKALDQHFKLNWPEHISMA